MADYKPANLASPFQDQLVKEVGMHDDADDLTGRNPCPHFSQPHDMGPDTIPVVFEEGELGRRYHGPVDKHAAKVSSTMGGNRGK
jgi:hypothetical protein